MDVSLDDYINKSNFKVKIGNPNFKANQNVRQTAGAGFQAGKKRFVAGFQSNKVTDVSITVPAVRKTATNTNRTNPVRDARDKLSTKPKPLDARERLNQKQQNVDARQKLITIRANKEPFDARAKIQAKKQQTGQSDKTTGPFSLTRTVANQNTQMTVPGAQQITRTLTKVMPPGYENIAAPTNAPSKQQQQTKGLSSVKMRLGPPQSAGRDLQNITVTRTVPNLNTQPQRQFVTNQQPPGAPPQAAPFHIPEPAPPAPSYHPSNYGPPQPGPPHGHYPPPPQSHGGYQAPPAQPQYNPPYPTHSYPSPHTPQPPPTAPAHQAPPTHLGPRPNPPYPIDDNMGVRLEVPQHPSMSLPKIQVHNDQYRPQEPPQYQQYVAPPPEPYPPAQYSGYAAPTQYPPDHGVHRSIPSPEPQFVKTIQNTSQPAQTTSHPTLKRRSTDSTGPLRMSSTNSIPVIGSLDRSRPSSSSVASDNKYSKMSIPLQEPPVKKLRDEAGEGDVISPLQGFKVLISNLNSTVTQDDVIELFGSVGAVKKVRLAKGGLGEVIYVKKEDAINAVKNYHERELDGLPMVVKVATSLTAKVKEVTEKLPPSAKPAANEPLKLYKKPAGGERGSDKKGVEVAVLHKALFKTGAALTTKPVTFTVNI